MGYPTYSTTAAAPVKALVAAYGSPVIIDGGWVHNPNASAGFIHFFDAAATSDVTAGTTVPVMSLRIFAGSIMGLSPDIIGTGLIFTNGLVLSATDNKGADNTNTNITTGFEVDLSNK